MGRSLQRSTGKAQSGDRMDRYEQPHEVVVVVVEDDSDLRDLLDGCLTAEGYRTILLAESSQAAAVIRHEQPHLIILDIWLEQPASGWWLLRALQRDARTGRIPVLVYSAHAFLLTEMAQSFRAPHYVFVSKPFQFDRLLAQIQTLVERARSSGGG